jgi:hypothetical protein
MECLHCQQPPKGGRADRKFCCPTCKYEYHNGERTQENAERRRILLALKRNHRILKGLQAPLTPFSVKMTLPFPPLE